MSMILKSDGTEFELALVEHRFEEGQDGERDEVWPELSFRVGTETDSWEETAPCMNMHELHALIEWLDAVGSGAPELEAVDILEANLGFSLEEEQNGDVTLRIDFNLENTPAWAVLDTPTEEATAVRLKLRRDQFRVAAQELRADVSRLQHGSE